MEEEVYLAEPGETHVIHLKLFNHFDQCPSHYFSKGRRRGPGQPLKPWSYTRKQAQRPQGHTPFFHPTHHERAGRKPEPLF